jgi:hypothetical protein
MTEKEAEEELKKQIAKEISEQFPDLKSISGEWDGPSRQSAEDWAREWMEKKEAAALIDEQINQKKEPN